MSKLNNIKINSFIEVEVVDLFPLSLWDGPTLIILFLTDMESKLGVQKSNLL
jgi:hypothetical protein